MKNLVIAAALLFTSLAFAESEFVVKVNRIEMAVTAPDESEAQADGTEAAADAKAQNASSDSSDKPGLKAATGATDYNSSRSNNSSAIDADDDGDGIEATTCPNGVDDDCDSPREAEPAKRNSTRSK